MASARKRAQTVGFSSHAVINLRDGSMCLSWRIGDFRRYHMVEGTAQAQIVYTIEQPTGKVDLSYEDLTIQQKDIVLVTPTIVFHRIEPGSPLYKMGLEDLRKASFELVVSFTYTDDSTGMLHQTRTSYMPDEILWGHLFQEMIRVNKRHYKVDYNLFNHTAKVHVPISSAEGYDLKKGLELSARLSPRHLPRCSPRPSPKTNPQNHHDNCLKPPVVTVELMDDTSSKPNDPTNQGESRHQGSLTVPNDLSPEKDV